MNRLLLFVPALTAVLASPSAFADSPATVVSFTKKTDSLTISIAGKGVAEYVWRDDHVHHPYFRSVRELGGVQVTRPFPPQPGELDDHAHMHPGLWLGFGSLGGADFWRNRDGMRVEHVRFAAEPRGGAVSGSFAVVNRFRAGSRTVCEQTCRFDVEIVPGGWLLRIDTTFRSDDADFAFGDQQEMGLAVRMAPELSVVRGARMIDSEGRRDEKQIWGRRADWCDYGGESGGRPVGVVLFAHPKNFRPSRMHSRDYGALVVNPFGQKDFRKGEEFRLTVRKGEEFRLRLGAFVYGGRGKVDAKAIYSRYAERAK